MTNLGTLLWVDDDGEDRFLHEQYNIQRKGWDVIWALTVREAARRLSQEPFEAMLLDQMLPSNAADEPNVLGGYALLYWLRKKKGLPEFDFLNEIEPLESNRKIDVTVVSAFFDEEITKRIKDVDQEVELIAKPIDLDKLLGHLGEPAFDRQQG